VQVLRAPSADSGVAGTATQSCFPHKKATARDHVYSDCKAAYLAVTAERLSTFEGSDSLPVCDISFSLLNNDPTKPVLVLRPQYRTHRTYLLSLTLSVRRAHGLTGQVRSLET